MGEKHLLAFASTRPDHLCLVDMHALLVVGLHGDRLACGWVDHHLRVSTCIDLHLRDHLRPDIRILVMVDVIGGLALRLVASGNI